MVLEDFGYGRARIGPADSVLHGARLYGGALAGAAREVAQANKATLGAVGGAAAAALASFSQRSRYVRQRRYLEDLKEEKDYKSDEDDAMEVLRYAGNRGAPPSSDNRWRRGHLSILSRRPYYMARRFARRRRFRRRKRSRTRKSRWRRGYKRKLRFSKRRRVPTYMKVVMKSSKAAVYENSWPVAVQAASQGKCCLVVPMFDAAGVYNGNILGDGSGKDTAVTMEKWNAAYIDGPVTLSQWMMTCGINPTWAQSGRQKFLIGPRSYEWMISNQENIPISCEIYWCKPRRDLDYNAGAFASHGDAFIWGTDLNDIMCRALDRDGLVTYGAACMFGFDLNITPFMSTTFCQLFKVLKVKKYELDAGQCMRLKHVAKKSWIIDDWEMVSAAANLAWRKRQIFPVIKLHGCTGTDSVVPTKVGSGRALIAIMYKVHWKFWQMNTNLQQAFVKTLTNPQGAVGTFQYVSKPAAAVINENP